MTQSRISNKNEEDVNKEKSLVSPLCLYFYDINGNCNNLDFTDGKLSVDVKKLDLSEISNDEVVKIVKIINDFTSEKSDSNGKIIIPIYVINIYHILTNGNYNRTEV